MKKLVGLALTIILLIGLVACGSKPKPIIYKQGTYEGNAEGHIGPIKVQIITDQYVIKNIVILEGTRNSSYSRNSIQETSSQNNKSQ